MLALVIAGCTPSEPEPTPDTPASSAQVEEVVSAEDGPLALSIREVSQEGWSGRMVVVRLRARDGRRVRVLPAERPTPLAELVAPTSPPQPFAAICGGFYDPSGDPMGLVRVDGREVSPLGENGGSGVFAVGEGDVRILRADGFDPAHYASAIQSIDRLVSRGESLVRSGSDRRAARSAVAIAGSGELRFAVAFDTRAIASEDPARIELGPESARTGPTLAQWAELLRLDEAEGGVGATEALGLDGGYSTSLVVKSNTRALSVVATRATINGLLVTY